MDRRIPKGESREHSRKRLLQVAGWPTLVLTILLFWLAASSFFPKLIPGPQKVLAYLLSTPLQLVVESLARTLYNSILGFGIALGLSIASVFLAYINRFLESFFTSLNTFIQSVSVLVWTLVLIMIFGVLSPIPPILVTTAATYPVLLSTMLGASKALDRRFRELSAVLGASKTQEFTTIILPGSVPYIASASRAAIGIALRISVVAEAFGGGGGVGYQLMYNYDLGIPEGVFAWALLLVLLMILLDHAILKPMENWTKRWLL